MAIAPGNKRRAATLDPKRQQRLAEILSDSTDKSFTDFVRKWIDQEYVLFTQWNKKIK
ncbi:hypothetical protein IGJ28_003504 [Enterococcus sp. AZ091]|uniref:hypothetical protein n=1 Tax=Enterococcus sp. AZ091 TaxID=2774720 RepID=UPI003F26ACFF